MTTIMTHVETCVGETEERQLFSVETLHPAGLKAPYGGIRSLRGADGRFREVPGNVAFASHDAGMEWLRAIPGV